MIIIARALAEGLAATQALQEFEDENPTPPPAREHRLCPRCGGSTEWPAHMPDRSLCTHDLTS